MKKRLNSGQAILIVMLVMAVVLVMVLSMVARSVTDVKVSKTEEEASRAFSAAEAGVESALLTGEAKSGDVDGSPFSVSFASAGYGEKYNHPESLGPGETAVIWFVGHDEDEKLTCTMEIDGTPTNVCYNGNFIVYWNYEGATASIEPAIEVSVYYSNGINFSDFSNVKVQRSTFDPKADRRVQNYFAAPGPGGDIDDGEEVKTYKYWGDVAKPLLCFNSPCMIMASVRMLYNPPGEEHNIGIIAQGGGVPIPPQGKKIQSTGTSGEATRKVEVYKLFPAPPSIFEAAIYSQNSLIK